MLPPEKKEEKGVRCTLYRDLLGEGKRDIFLSLILIKESRKGFVPKNLGLSFSKVNALAG